MANRSKIQIKGLTKVQNNTTKKLRGITGDLVRGMSIMLAWLKGKVIKVTPVDFGFLRASAYIETLKTKDGPTGEIGFTTDYAPFVHENEGANFKVPGTMAKFLEKPAMDNSDRIIQIVGEEAKIK